MATRKWTVQTIGEWIGETAQKQRAESEQRPVAEAVADLELLDILDLDGLEHLGVRLGAVLWQCRLDAAALQMLGAALMQPPIEELDVAERALLRTLVALLYALAPGDRPLTASADPAALARLGDRVIGGLETRETLMDTAFMRSLIEPLLGNDRPAVRRLLGAISSVLIQLEAAGEDGRLAYLAGKPLYWELKTLQWVLSGVLQASHARGPTEIPVAPA